MPSLETLSLEVAMLSSAVVPLLSSIIGGVLVLAGQALARKHEDRRVWLTHLYEASGDLATSYLQEAALVNDSRRSKKRKTEVATTTYITDRQKALGRFRTLPWASCSSTSGRLWVKRSRLCGARGIFRTRTSNSPTTRRGVPSRLLRRLLAHF
jgi:hypothetical protein